MMYIGLKTFNIFYSKISLLRNISFKKEIVLKRRDSDISHDDKTFIECNESSDKEKMKKRPNYFVGVQINDPDVKASIKRIQDSLLLQNKNLEKCLISTNKLHLTLMVMHLKDVEDHSKAMKALRLVHQKYNRAICEEPIKLEFEGLGQFNNKVLFAKVKDNTSCKRLYDVAKCINSFFANVGIYTTDTRKELNLHLTIAKVDFKHKSSKAIKKIQPSLYKEFVDLNLGYDTVKSIQLLKMCGPKTSTGYYSGDELLFSSSDHIHWRNLNSLLAIAEKKKEIRKSISDITKKLFS